MDSTLFDQFFLGEAKAFLQESIDCALREDGTDLTTNAVFASSDMMEATLVAKQDSLLAGLAFIPWVLEATKKFEPGACRFILHVSEGSFVSEGTVAATFYGAARVVLRAERIILNYITHLSGIANLVQSYVQALQGTGVRLLDTRKTLPGLRYPEKYAVRIGGGYNHRFNLAEMLMLKDNHIDAAGGITPAVAKLRCAYDPMPPIEVECRNLAEVTEAVACGVSRIMLDNMTKTGLAEALPCIPAGIEVEISGGVTLETIRDLVCTDSPRKPDFVSVGRLTHSAPSADFSLLTKLV